MPELIITITMVNWGAGLVSLAGNGDNTTVNTRPVLQPEQSSSNDDNDDFVMRQTMRDANTSDASDSAPVEAQASLRANVVATAALLQLNNSIVPVCKQ